MLVGSREEARRHFVAVRSKMLSGAPLDPLERILAEVIGAHPEYHALLDGGEDALSFEATVDGVNPFLHLGLHVALVEQLQTDRPAGILNLYRQLVGRLDGDVHAAEHRVMECLAGTLTASARAGRPPDEASFLDCVRSHLR